MRDVFFIRRMFLGFALGGMLSASAFETNSISNLVFWISADVGVSTNTSGTVTQWVDRSSASNTVTLLAGTPYYQTNYANGKPAIAFQGGTDALTFNEITNIRTTFWVVNELFSAVTEYRPVLGGAASYDFHRGESKNIFGMYTPSVVVNGSVQVNGSAVGNGTGTPVPTAPGIIAVQCAGAARADQIGRDRGVVSRVWHGSIAEVMIFSHVLTADELNTVGVYLSEKYDIASTYLPEDSSRPVITNAGDIAAITRFSATLVGSLVSSGSSATAVSFYWGTADGGTNPAAWAGTNHLGGRDPGPVTAAVSSLTEDSRYYYTFAASNGSGTVWARPSRAFRTASDPFPWPFYMKIRVPGYDRPEVLTNFPLLVQLGEHREGFDYSQFFSPPYDDLRFFDTNQVQLNYEVDEWVTNGVSSVWVQVPRLSGSGSYLWARWGRRNCPGFESATNGATWSEDYRGVWHLQEAVSNGGTQRDSTVYANHGEFSDTNGSSVAGSTGGVIAAANYYTGAGAYVQIPHHASINPLTVTLELWARSTPEFWSNYGILMSKRNSYMLHPSYPSSRLVAFYVWAPAALAVSYTPVEIQSWRHYAATYDGQTLRFYVNGLEANSSASGGAVINPDTGPLYLGRDSPGAGPRFLSGWLDEVRVSDGARPAHWIWAAWANQKAGSTFVEYDPVQFRPLFGGIMIRIQ